ncbi:rab-GTPase-TBC domain-containing protein [Massariosphaeria phaeospora]|uniref:Rab-GTPase-TBC domain-containing protein n=1 Tax=Massariosphaeria phaeospora TaxID=100035 RepID=A0A7C8MFP4_9PLEO|nr:rab-GTPase-TBC domain-containing protein [Massariosphaeria phaeospora]
MRTLSEAEKHWRQLDDFHSLTDLKIFVSSHKEPQITSGLRSVTWKIFLLFKTLDRSSWPTHLSDSRTTYESLRSHYLRAIQHPDEFESSVDPLSENEESPWAALRADEALRAEIFQDIERCMPDNMYFRQPATQNMMLDVLFVWCKMHPDIGYRQGMHEILAPVLWVVERDAVDTTHVDNTHVDHRAVDHTLADMLNAGYIEHDTHTLYSLIMQTAKSFYAPADEASTSKETPMLIRSSRIFERYLPKADPELSAHLVKLEIVPQIFLLRWIRLLFGREFPLDSVLDVWDALFAIDSTLELVDMISISMLLRIRWSLVAADTNEAFSLLLRYPEPNVPAYTFIKDALYLRDHLTPEGGSEIITRYGQKRPNLEAKLPPSIRLPSPSPSFASHRSRPSLGSPRSFVNQQSAGIESLLQGAAKGVLERGSQWGVGKAIRDAVGEVRKNVESYQSASPTSGQTTPRAGGREYRKPEQLAIAAANQKPALERMHSANAIKKIESIEKRNRRLAKMLESAVGELWEHHRQRSEDEKEDKAGIEALSLAIAKVQFVQVYMEDSSIPLPVDEMTEQAATANAAASLTSPGALSPTVTDRTSSESPIPSTPQTFAESSTANEVDQSTLLSPLAKSSAAHKPHAQSSLSPRSRPLLTSSNFSWMLGQEAPPSTFASVAAHTAFPSDEKRRLKGKGFLFGDEDNDSGSPKERKRGNASGKGGSKGGKGKANAEQEIEEEIIDLDDVGKRGSVS